MTAERYRQQARADEAERRASMLESRLARLEQALGGQVPPAAGDPQPPRMPAQESAAPLDVESRARQLAAEQLDAQSFNDACNRAVEAGRKDIPTFDGAVSTLASMGALFESSGEPTTLARTIMDSDIAHRIIDALGRDPEQAEKILDMTPRQQARAIGLLEARLLASAPAAPPPVSNAPPPVRPVGNRGVSQSNTPADNDSTEDWIRKRNRQLYGSK